MFNVLKYFKENYNSINKYEFLGVSKNDNNILKNGKKVKKLGDGGFATVTLYKCKNKLSFAYNKLFVIKKITLNGDGSKLDAGSVNFDKSFDKKITKVVINEYIMNTLLIHENIISVHGLDIYNLALLYKYEYSKDLLYYFMDDNFEPIKYFKYFIQIIDAVRYMHSFGIAHMDLKLENILLNPIDNKIKIIDFGHSCFFKKGSVLVFHKGIKGTEYYMPPEVWKSAYMADKVDVWCCGMILYNFIYNRIPWEKALTNDRVFIKFKKYRMQNALDNELFKHPTLYGFNYDDSCIILELFLMMFNLDYYNRCNINSVYRKLLKITLEQ